MAETLLVLRIVLAALLYAFLGLLFYVIWRDLHARSRQDGNRCQPANLTVQSDTHPEQRFTLRPVTAIGRGADNHIVVDDRFASANHAMVVWREQRWWVEDLNSHNGTYLNGERISEPHALSGGDLILVGETLLRFEMEGETQ